MDPQTAFVCFGEIPPTVRKGRFSCIISPAETKQVAQGLALEWYALEDLTLPGSIYEASTFVGGLPHIPLMDGTPLSKAFIYKDFELWWVNYSNIFHKFALPYSQYAPLLDLLKRFSEVMVYGAQHHSLFSCFFEAYGIAYNIEYPRRRFGSPVNIPFGMMVQIMLTSIFVVPLLVLRRKILVVTGDKFEAGKDYDFRMRGLYEELRRRRVPFVESIRSLEPTRSLLARAWFRKRPVLYAEAIIFIGRFLSWVTGGRRKVQKRFGKHTTAHIVDADTRFRLLVGLQYMLTVYDDVWAIRINRTLFKLLGIRSAFISATTERNYHIVLACKLNGIPTVGILHGVASKDYNLYDFIPGFTGKRKFSVDEYGVWSEWWKEYYTKYSAAYDPTQLKVVGLMKPMERKPSQVKDIHGEKNEGKTRVLLVSEVVAEPAEVVPYLDALLNVSDIELAIKFRPSHDVFEAWLKKQRPDILEKIGASGSQKGAMYEAVALSDVVIGTQSTGVVEASIQGKPFVLFYTKKWGDYYNMQSFNGGSFFAEDPHTLVARVRASAQVDAHVIAHVRERFFGDPYRNGCVWVVDQLLAHTRP